eukprot:m.142928 g.142928  ORF g.142928 m.142928 type:complete len:88 (+) comp22952_c0_seq1:228-491(+)
MASSHAIRPPREVSKGYFDVKALSYDLADFLGQYGAGRVPVVEEWLKVTFFANELCFVNTTELQNSKSGFIFHGFIYWDGAQREWSV